MIIKTEFRATDLSCIRQHKLLFSHISLTLFAGEAALITGANGSGKSSLLRLLAGLATPANGEIFWQQQSILANRLDYSEHLHYLGHTNGIKLGLTVLENLQLSQHLHHSKLTALDAVLEKLHLWEFKNTPAAFLSAGQKRRIALAKLWLFPKTLWLLDEPLTALDAEIQAAFLLKLESHLEGGGMAVVSSHHPVTLSTANLKLLRLLP